MADSKRGPQEQGTFYRVKVGDSVPSIAYELGHCWATIWNHPQNKALRELRRTPNILLEGDKLFIPERTFASYERPTGKWHEFKRRGVPSKLRLTLVEPLRTHVFPLAELLGDARPPAPEKAQDPPKPWAGVAYALTIDGVEIQGKTGDDGVVETSIRPNVRTALLVVAKGTPDERTIHLDVGHLRPADTERGALERLENLGYLKKTGPATAATPQQISAAIALFQGASGLPPTGELDDATRYALEDLHGS